MMDPREEKINELLLDNRFVDWVINPQSPYAGYWLQWINSSLDHALLAEEARDFLLELRKSGSEAGQQWSEEVTGQMLDHIKQAIGEETVAATTRRPVMRRWYWAAAAAVVLGAIIVGISFSKKTTAGLAVVQPAKQGHQSPEMIRYNGNQQNELIFLPDGSKVILAKGARISYNRLMNERTRKVILTGEAFFDVAKDPEKPFYIHTQYMIIKVLGTSFRVQASAGRQAVIVKTGKVSVFLKGQDLEQSAAKILLPRQVCTYSIASHDLVTSTYKNPAKIEIVAEDNKDYYFEEAPLADVLQTLEHMYDLPVHFDKEVFKNCFITISLENESLEEKLKILTKTIGASFSISDYGISIEGKSCQ